MKQKNKLNGSLNRLAEAFGDVLREAVEEAVEPVKSDMSQLRQALEVTDGNVLELKKDVSGLKKDVSDFKSRFDTFEAKIDALKNGEDGVDGYDADETRVVSLEVRMDRIEVMVIAIRDAVV